MTLGDCPVMWVSKLQTEIALSTTEAEYVALSQAMRDLLPLRTLLSEIVTKMKLPLVSDNVDLHSTVFEDNNGALAIATSPKLTPRSKHIHVKYHFFESRVGKGRDKGITLCKVDTDLQKADIFTKGLEKIKFEQIRKLLMVRSKQTGNYHSAFKSKRKCNRQTNRR